MSFLKHFAGCCMAVLLVSCTSMDIETQASSSVDFARLKTYAWMSEPLEDKGQGEDEVDRGFIDSSVRGLVDERLRKKGFRLDRTGSPDFVVGYSTMLNEVIDRDIADSSYDEKPASGLAFGGRQQGWEFGVQEPAGGLREYEQGVLTLNVVDPEERKLIWHGVAKAQIDTSQPEHKREKRVKRAVTSLLSHFPNQGTDMRPMKVER